MPFHPCKTGKNDYSFCRFQGEKGVFYWDKSRSLRKSE
ncbi:hypothetical protein B4096_2133 [Heyndrickxia coagulans]|uniref:Uncharacterized protein n=1 Tax=Heyndrickxia coagulans TaxID=1398 RepID=A0A150JWT4_HEYCO|nr:hypothetical protein B4099_2188 [Heyndrickxia coagulans]KYC79896.1 hypothetical protein B4096_2133 [Heyndrickxia coagulans]